MIFFYHKRSCNFASFKKTNLSVLHSFQDIHYFMCICLLCHQVGDYLWKTFLCDTVRPQSFSIWEGQCLPVMAKFIVNKLSHCSAGQTFFLLYVNLHLYVIAVYYCWLWTTCTLLLTGMSAAMSLSFARSRPSHSHVVQSSLGPSLSPAPSPAHQGALYSQFLSNFPWHCYWNFTNFISSYFRFSPCSS
jgi:hypothetical protein